MAYNAHKQTLIPRNQGEDLQILGATTKLKRNPNLGFSFWDKTRCTTTNNCKVCDVSTSIVSSLLILNFSPSEKWQKHHTLYYHNYSAIWLYQTYLDKSKVFITFSFCVAKGPERLSSHTWAVGIRKKGQKKQLRCLPSNASIKFTHFRNTDYLYRYFFECISNHMNMLS